MMNYKQVIQDIQTIANANKYTNDWQFGDVYELATWRTYLYPIVWLSNATSTYINGAIVYQTDLMVADILKDDHTNLQDCLNITEQIGREIISILKNNPDGYIVNDVTATSFTQKFSDLLAGWVFTIQIQVMYDYPTCDYTYPAPYCVTCPPSGSCTAVNFPLVNESGPITLTHNLNKYPYVTFQDANGVSFCSYSYPSLNAIDCTFNPPFTGTVTCQ